MLSNCFRAPCGRTSRNRHAGPGFHRGGTHQFGEAKQARRGTCQTIARENGIEQCCVNTYECTIILTITYQILHLLFSSTGLSPDGVSGTSLNLQNFAGASKSRKRKQRKAKRKFRKTKNKRKKKQTRRLEDK